MILFLEPMSGMSGNMFAGALSDLMQDSALNDELDARVDALGIDGTRWVRKRVEKRGVDCLHMDVEHPEQHAHRHLSDCVALLEKAGLSEGALALAVEIFTVLADAEAAVHGTTREGVHFHEVGAVDAIVDILSAAFFVDKLRERGVRAIHSAPLRTGFGFVECAHGTMPVPAPATARLLEGTKVFRGDVEGEFTTPTGAAIAKVIVDKWESPREMNILSQGWGAGTRDAPHPNALRALLVEVDEVEREWSFEEVLEARFHVDDMSGESLGDMSERLMEHALDVAMFTGVGKKGRPVTEVRVIARANDEDDILRAVFKLSTTLGVRVFRAQRATLPREEGERDGVRFKRANGRTKFEHDDLAARARREDRAVFDVARDLERE